MWRRPLHLYRRVFDVSQRPARPPRWRGPWPPECEGYKDVLVYYKDHPEVCRLRRWTGMAGEAYNAKLIWKKFKCRGLEANRLVRFIGTDGEYEVRDLQHRDVYAIWLGPLWSPEKEEMWRRESAFFLVKWWRRFNERRQQRAAPDEGTQPLLT
ncbi:unnamed protein product [Vitrella brassicaformis CCMP3155]|uniref:Uncharacterized protein n=1 Tax=Vitrella brassicaformis (strain CCMP3155) TaxID=1169540 RepID=A0A0G4EQR8_VITBC|nr:unnamed protein product [Vitrella brassicaformis CCMP3155]|eukprot:CEL99812.1 unnamed protein product [Vitrella brassicaformis CCMP3155]